MTVVKEWQNGDKVEFASGRFDEWCVYIVRNGAGRRAPRDVEYFTYFHELGQRHSAEQVLEYVRAVYRVAARTINATSLGQIAERALNFGDESDEAEFWGTVLYSAMVAEENNPKPLKKRVKMLGLHQLLVDRMAPEEAADWSRGRRFPELDAECRKRGF